MLLAKVVGTVVATKKDETLVGSKLLIVQPLRKGIDDTKENLEEKLSDSTREQYGFDEGEMSYS